MTKTEDTTKRKRRQHVVDRERREAKETARRARDIELKELNLAEKKEIAEVVSRYNMLRGRVWEKWNASTH